MLETVTWRSPWVSCKLPYNIRVMFCSPHKISPYRCLTLFLYLSFFFLCVLAPPFHSAGLLLSYMKWKSNIRNRIAELLLALCSGDVVCICCKCILPSSSLWPPLLLLLLLRQFHCIQCAVCLLRDLTAPNIFIFTKILFILFPMHIHSIFTFSLFLCPTVGCIPFSILYYCYVYWCWWWWCCCLLPIWFVLFVPC